MSLVRIAGGAGSSCMLPSSILTTNKYCCFSASQQCLTVTVVFAILYQVPGILASGIWDPFILVPGQSARSVGSGTVRFGHRYRLWTSTFDWLTSTLGHPALAASE